MTDAQAGARSNAISERERPTVIVERVPARDRIDEINGSKELSHFRLYIPIDAASEVERTASRLRAGNSGFAYKVSPDYKHRGFVIVDAYMQIRANSNLGDPVGEEHRRMFLMEDLVFHGSLLSGFSVRAVASPNEADSLLRT